MVYFAKFHVGMITTVCLMRNVYVVYVEEFVIQILPVLLDKFVKIVSVKLGVVLTHHVTHSKHVLMENAQIHVH